MRYEIKGGNLPVVLCYLENGETIVTEGGGMSWMSPNMKMSTSSNGGIGKMIGRSFAGEKMFQNIYTAENGTGMIAFASSFAGEIRAFDIAPGNDIILQKHAYLAGSQTVTGSVAFNKISAGLFGGEGFIMQRYSGQGVVFAEFDGSVVEYELAAGQSLLLSTGHLGGMSGSCTMEIERVKGAKNVLFGGEGLFNTKVTGPGRVYVQTMPVINLAERLQPYIQSSNN